MNTRMNLNKLKLGELLVYSGKISQPMLENALSVQRKTGKKLGEVLVNERYITEDDIIEVLEFQLGIPHLDLDTYNIDPEIARSIPESLVRRYELVAVDNKDGVIMVAMSDPLNIFAIDDVKLALKKEIQPVISSKEKILRTIERFYRDSNTQKALQEFEDAFTPITTEVEEIEEDAEITSAPIVKLLSSIIDQAVKDKASDIHIEPQANEIRVRYRVDGDLKEIMKLGRNSLSGLVTRVKIIGKMNIAEKRIPQDGRVEAIINNKEIDMRISTLPTIYGEKTVIRLLDKSSFNFNKESIGFSPEDMKKFDTILAQPYGMILVTGPTGSGKSTTLYAVLQELNDSKKNIITVEDPVEYKLNGINQVHVNAKAGLTFANGLRSILRQDPDIVMIGEIRDGETAEIAVRAAITGHMVLSTLHTNDSPSTIARLVDMGIEPYLVSSAVIGILSQRLVKRLCPKCKQAYEANENQKKVLEVPLDEPLTLYKAVGCNNCTHGYRGRIAVHELMVVNEKMREIVDRNGTLDDIRKQALADGMSTLLKSAGRVAKEGTTSFEEVLRIGYTLG